MLVTLWHRCEEYGAVMFNIVGVHKKKCVGMFCDISQLLWHICS